MNRYAVSDLHGQLDLYNQIKEYINDNDVVYALGDFGDRGPHPWTTLKAVLDDRQFIYLMGNHDYMLMKAIEEYIYYENRDGFVDLNRYMFAPHGQIALCVLNGGLDTLLGWEREPNRMEYYQQLRFLPLEIRLAALDGEHFIYLNHAGRTPSHIEVDPEKVGDFVWDRLHIYDKWDNFGKHILIGGHSPISYLVKQFNYYNKEYELKEGCLFYDGGSKICIDRAAYHTGETVLLNIDTFEHKIFTTKEKVDEKF